MRLMTRSSDAQRSSLLPWLPGPTWGDLVAALTVALLLIPQCLAYAELAGLPAHVGLVAAAVPPLIGGAFGSSAHLQTGPVALTALVTFGALSTIEEPGTAAYIQLAALLAFLVGAIRIVLGVARLGRLAYLMTAPVVLGFTTGAAVVITASQVPAVLGVTSEHADVLHSGVHAATHLAEWRLAAIGLALLTAGIVLIGRRFYGRRFPGVLIAVAGAVLLGRYTGYDSGLVGSIPTQVPIPDPSNIPWGRTGTIAIAALVIAVVDFAEPAAIARRFAEEDHQEWDPSRELTGQGVANVASGLVGGFPVGGSFSRSSLNRMAGGETRWSGIFAGAIVLLFLPVAGVLESLPRAALAATVIVAVYKLIDLPGIWAMLRADKIDGLTAVGTAAITLAMEPRVHYAVVIAITASAMISLVQRWLPSRRSVS
jgi:sulfate permease, SulP family